MGDRQIVEEGEGLFFAALHIEREGRAGAGAVAVVDVGLARARIEEAEIADAFDLGMVAQESADLGRVLAGAGHAQLQRLQAAQQHPGGVGIANAAHDVAHHPHLVDDGAAADNGAGDEVAMAAGIFGQAVDADVGALGQRLGPQGPEEGVVDGDRRQLVLALEGGGAGGVDRLDIDQSVGRVGRAFEINQRDAALGPGRRHHLIQLLARRPGREVDVMDAPLRQDLVDDRLAGRVERAGMDDDVARSHQRQQQGRNGRHAAGEGQRRLGILPDLQPVLEDLLVGSVEARIDQALGGAAAGPLAGDALEKALALRRRLENEGGGEEDRRLQRPFRQSGVEAVAHHQRRRLQLVIADGRRGLPRQPAAGRHRIKFFGHMSLPFGGVLAPS